MSNDTFTWTMTAFPHKSAIDALRLEIREARANGSAVPTGLILDLIPLSSAQAQQLAERAPFQFSGDKFESVGDALRSEIYDPVLDVYYVSVPEVWNGSVTTNAEGSVEIVFETPIQLELPRLASLGISRSKFQRLTKVTGSPDRVVSELIDETNGATTLLDVHLTPTAEPLAHGFTGKMLARASSPCEGGDEANWNVYERRNSAGMCVVHEGDYIYGGEVAYDRKFGPDTKEACEQYARNNCPLSHGG